MSIEQFEYWSLVLGLSALVGYMFFIIYKLARESGAPRFGYVALFLSLGLGMFGFIIKGVLQEVLKI
jgi:hypothetical protein